MNSCIRRIEDLKAVERSACLQRPLRSSRMRKAKHCSFFVILSNSLGLVSIFRSSRPSQLCFNGYVLTVTQIRITVFVSNIVKVNF